MKNSFMTENADNIDITVLPPEPDILSDCDEGDDDITCEYEVDDVSGNIEIQLQGPNVCSGDNENFGNQDNNSKTKSSKNGYCYKFSVYADKDNNSIPGLLQGSQVIINLLEDIQNPNDHAGF
ncbi:hypothetical protein ILUMI_25054 [Ignelater luminosus]|uniref:Uncharacterized protein n=1 Tax=Ignelater luminosus TaxID=2038154 RepID=A0A8K0G0B6_IGNLU|nr:hypothetical protein ILUMI_25054 [Ignelater luminosus]